MIAAVTIHRYLDVTPSSKLSDQIDAIFFEASNTKSFESDAARAIFRERWLGRYLRDDPQFAYLAFAASGDVAGYVVGAIDDPVLSERFADVGYFAAFGDLTRKYPAHLHVNLAPAFRNRGHWRAAHRGFCCRGEAERRAGRPRRDKRQFGQCAVL